MHDIRNCVTGKRGFCAECEISRISAIQEKLTQIDSLLDSIQYSIPVEIWNGSSAKLVTWSDGAKY